MRNTFSCPCSLMHTSQGVMFQIRSCLLFIHKNNLARNELQATSLHRPPCHSVTWHFLEFYRKARSLVTKETSASGADLSILFVRVSNHTMHLISKENYVDSYRRLTESVLISGGDGNLDCLLLEHFKLGFNRRIENLL